MKPAHYRVDHGDKLRLDRWDPDDHGGLHREEGEARTTRLLSQMAEWQARLYAEGRQSLLIVLQARDAGGKDGTVKHVFSGLNPQGVNVTSFKVPSPQEQAHDFLWRVHAHAPASGYIAIFNRSHYEDVLVPRAHGQLTKKQAEQRLEQIEHFEDLLVSRGTRVLKFYLHISKDEQLSRLRARLEEPDKRWKFNPGDLEERARWDDYSAAYELALPATSRKKAPWYVVPANHKWFRNLLISQVIVDTFRSMDPQFPEAQLDLAQFSEVLE